MNYICSVKRAKYPAYYIANLLTLYMTKEIRRDIYTQSEYAKLIGVTRARVNQMIKEGNIKTLKINGATLVKV